MIYKNILLVASSLATIVLLFGVVNKVAAESMIYDSSMVNYIKKITNQTGTYTEQRTIGNQTISINATVSKINDTEYEIKKIVHINGEKINLETFRVFNISNGTYKLVNEKLGINQTFTDGTNFVMGAGSGSSSSSGASITLYDRERGTPNTLQLYDNYFGCAGGNYAVFQAFVKPNVVDVNWVANQIYWHWCFQLHELKHGYVQYGTTKYLLDPEPNQAQIRGSHAFTNSHGGTTWYSVTAKFFYGSR